MDVDWGPCTLCLWGLRIAHSAVLPPTPSPSPSCAQLSMSPNRLSVRACPPWEGVHGGPRSMRRGHPTLLTPPKLYPSAMPSFGQPLPQPLPATPSQSIATAQHMQTAARRRIACHL
mmetsp:Transcript_148121/g.258891  ORF Transcript_148121/g.258891 Transcript_148121/m.258891 type:complete len:117 (-) Transcript_148121:260-610(-)